MDEERGQPDDHCTVKNGADDTFAPHKINYMHQVDERKMEHAAKTR